MHSVLANHDRALVHRAHFDPTAPDQLVDAIVTAVATVADRHPASIPPLAETADIGALEALLEHAGMTGSVIDATVAVEGLDVRVVSDGQILLYDHTGAHADTAAASQPSARSTSGAKATRESGSGTEVDAEGD